MANRYWVGGSATWDATAGSKWSTTSGGAGGSAVPTAADDVFFDANSGSVTVTIGASYIGLGANMDFTGFTGSIAGTEVLSPGTGSSASAFTLGSGMGSFAPHIYPATTGTTTITTNGITVGGSVMCKAGGTIILGSDLVSNGTYGLNFAGATGTINTGGYTVTQARMDIQGSSTRSLNFCVLNLTGTGVIWDIQSPGGGVTLTSSATFQVNVTDTSASSKTFTGNAFTYPSNFNLKFAPGGSGAAIISGGSTWNGIMEFEGPKTVNFSAGQTTTFSGGGRLIAYGTSGNLVAISSTSSGSAFTISRNTSGEPIVINWCSLKDCTGSGTSGKFAANTTNVSGNSGWTFGGNRYWVGGNGTWNATAGSKWSTTSGGGGGAAVPNRADMVYLDAASGAVTVTIESAYMIYMGSFDCTGFTGTLAGDGAMIVCAPNSVFKLSSGMTWSKTSYSQYTYHAGGTVEVTMAGKVWSTQFSISYDGLCHNNITKFMDAFNSTGEIQHDRGVLDTNDQAVTVSNIRSMNITWTTDYYRSSIITLTGGMTTPYDNSASGTIIPGTSTIIMSDTSSNPKTFDSGAMTYYKLKINGGSGTVTINGGGSFYDIECVTPFNLFLNTSLNLRNSFIQTGIIASIIGGSGGVNMNCTNNYKTNTVTNCDIQNVIVRGGATWNAINCTKTGLSWGWHYLGSQGGIDQYTQLLLNGNDFDGATGFYSYNAPNFNAQNAAITFNGNAQLDTAQKKFGVSSLLLDGSGDYLSLSSSTDLSLTTEDFTWDFWGKLVDYSTARVFMGKNTDSSNRYYFWMSSDKKLRFSFDRFNIPGYSLVTTSAISIDPTDGFHHYALTRYNGTFAIYVDGVSQPLTNTFPSGFSLTGIGGSFYIGSVGSIGYYNGWIDELRIVKGKSLWTNNFSPPTSAAIGETNISLLCHFDGTDGVASTYGSQKRNSNPQTVAGNVQVDTAQKKFGTGSILFDGSGDYLQYSDEAWMDFGTGDFTIDFWVRFNSRASTYAFFSRNGSTDFRLVLTSGNALILGANSGQLKNETWNPSTGTWYHVAVTRSGTNLDYWIDGTKLGTTTTDSTNLNYASDLIVGGQIGSFELNGWMDEFRISNGIGRWTSNFTPPTGEYTEYYSSETNNDKAFLQLMMV